MDLAELHRRSLAEFTDRVRRVRPDQWSAPTPCADWDVRALVNHVVGEDRWTAPLFAGATIVEVGDRFDGDLLGADPAGNTAEAAKEAEAAVGEPGALDRTVHLSFGETPAREYAEQLLADHLVHAWDLAVAIDADPRLDAEAVHHCAAWFAAREELYRGAGAIGPAVDVPPGAGEQDRLLAAFGRDPGWSATGALLGRFNAAFAAGDVDAVMALMTDDCVFESTSPAPDGVRHEGAAAVRAVWERLFADTAEPAFTSEETVARGDRGIVRWRFCDVCSVPEFGP